MNGEGPKKSDNVMKTPFLGAVRLLTPVAGCIVFTVRGPENHTQLSGADRSNINRHQAISLFESRYNVSGQISCSCGHATEP